MEETGIRRAGKETCQRDQLPAASRSVRPQCQSRNRISSVGIAEGRMQTRRSVLYTQECGGIPSHCGRGGGGLSRRAAARSGLADTVERGADDGRGSSASNHATPTRTTAGGRGTSRGGGAADWADGGAVAGFG